MVLVQRGQSLGIPGTFPQPDGTRARGRISLDLRAVPANLPEAELRCLQLHAAIQAGTYPPELLWTPKRSNPPSPDRSVLTCGQRHNPPAG